MIHPIYRNDDNNNISNTNNNNNMKNDNTITNDDDDNNNNNSSSSSSNTDNNVDTILFPKRIDILCGQDKACYTHEGSRYFRSIIDSYRYQYDNSSTKQEKMDITKMIFDNLKYWGSRFLKFDKTNQVWKQISEITARDKISHALRFANQQYKRNSSSSSKRNCNNKQQQSQSQLQQQLQLSPKSLPQQLQQQQLQQQQQQHLSCVSICSSCSKVSFPSFSSSSSLSSTSTSSSLKNSSSSLLLCNTTTPIEKETHKRTVSLETMPSSSLSLSPLLLSSPIREETMTDVLPKNKPKSEQQKQQQQQRQQQYHDHCLYHPLDDYHYDLKNFQGQLPPLSDPLQSLIETDSRWNQHSEYDPLHFLTEVDTKWDHDDEQQKCKKYSPSFECTTPITLESLLCMFAVEEDSKLQQQPQSQSQPSPQAQQQQQEDNVQCSVPSPLQCSSVLQSSPTTDIDKMATTTTAATTAVTNNNSNDDDNDDDDDDGDDDDDDDNGEETMDWSPFEEGETSEEWLETIAMEEGEQEQESQQPTMLETIIDLSQEDSMIDTQQQQEQQHKHKQQYHHYINDDELSVDLLQEDTTLLSPHMDEIHHYPIKNTNNNDNDDNNDDDNDHDHDDRATEIMNEPLLDWFQ